MRTVGRNPNHREFICGRDELARIFGVSPRRITQLVDAGMPQISRGRYDLAECFHWLKSWWQRKPVSDNSKLALERQRLYRSQRERTDLENTSTRDNLIPADDVLRVAERMTDAAAAQLDKAPHRLASELAGMDTPAQIQTLLLSEMRSVRAAIARSWDEIADQEAQRTATASMDGPHTSRGETP